MIKKLLVFSALCLAIRVAAAPQFELTGEAMPGALLIGRLAEPGVGVAVRFNDEPLRVSAEGVFTFGLGRDAKGMFTVTAQDESGETRRSYAIGAREYEIQRIEGVAQKHVDPPAEVLERIARENRQVGQARKRDDERTDFLQSFVWPLIGPVTGVYGSQRFYNGAPRSPHYGIDIAAVTGTKVVAPAAGLVTLAEPDLYFSGGTLIVDHGHGVSSTFIHLHKLLVKVGERVEQGQPIAEVGATGRATGPHLDWRMNWFGERLDPEQLMRQQNTPMPKSGGQRDDR